MVYPKISSMLSQFTPQNTTITYLDEALYQETSLLPRRGTGRRGDAPGGGREAFSRFGPARTFFVFLLLLYGASTCLAQRCGGQAGGAICADNLCCSQYGYCGSTSNYCGTGCQSGPCTGSGGCSPPAYDQSCSQYDYYCSQYLSSTNSSSAATPTSTSTGTDVSSIITSRIFDRFLPNRNSTPAYVFYTHAAFLAAAADSESYSGSGFGTTGTSGEKKRELAAFFANIAYETESGLYVEAANTATYCDTSSGVPCASGQRYYGRGPIQLSWNYNYKAAGDAIGFDGINNPGIVASNPTISFKTAVWYWMTQGSPTCHEAMVDGTGFGATIEAMNGALECGRNSSNPAAQESRVELYNSYCATLGVDPGSNLSC